MPSPSTEKQILSLPFRTGLSQKQDERWLDPGYLLTAQNAVQPKAQIVQKRPAYSSLTRTAIPPNLFTGPIAFQGGRRLGNIGTRLLAIAPDQWTDAAFTYDEASEQWMFADRVPEVYALPDRTVMSFDDTIREMDTVVSNGYALHVCLVTNIGQPLGQYQGRVYYRVENAATGEAVVAPQALDILSGGHGPYQSAPKVIACGSVVIVGVMSGNTSTGTFNLNLYAFDMTQPWAGWVGPTAITGLTNPQFTNQMGAWDIAPSTSTSFWVVYELGTVGSTAHLALTQVTIPGTAPFVPVAGTTINMASGDAAFISDGQPLVRSFGLDVTGNLATVAYAYSTAGGTLRVKVQQWNWSTITLMASAVDLMTAPGPLSATALGPDPPHTIQIAPISAIETVGGEAYRVAWSPQNSQWIGVDPDGEPGEATAFTACWTVSPNGFGAMIILNNSPRLTWGVAMASRWLPNVNGIGYCLARLPSFEQGTYYLFADDAWQDITSLNNGSGPNPISYFPMRVVATFAPRLSSWIFQNQLGGGAGFRQPDVQDQYLPHSVPHICPNAAAPGTEVYQSLISVSSTVQNQNPTLVQFDLDSPLAYQNACLGEQTGIATGNPSLTDGSRVHGFAFPYYPSITFAGAGNTGGSMPTGTFSYIPIYDWVDAKGQLHRSGRGSAQAVTVPTPGGTGSATITVTCMGFSDKEKAFTAISATHSPQSNGAVATPVTIRLFRTQANGEIYYEVAAAQNQQGQATITFTDVLSDQQIAENTLLYGDGLDSEQQGAILDNLCPPAFQGLIVHQNRYFGIDGNNIWASKELTSGEGSGFNELMAQSWDDGTGPITAMASLGSSLLLWKSDAMAYITGQGPGDDGGQNDWSPPIAIATDTGCIDWRSIVVKADGVYFDSAAGRRMIDFNLVVTPVPDVEDVLDQYPVTTSAVLHPTAGRILSTCNTDDTSVPRTGVIVVRDYVLSSWMTSVSTTLVEETPVQNGAVSAVVADAPVNGVLVPTYHWMDADGVVWRETPTEYQDGGSVYVPLQVVTAWIKAQGIENFARFRRLQLVWQNLDAHQLSVYVAYDFAPTWYLMGTVTAAMMSAMTSPLCQQLFALPRQRAEAVRFKIVDAADALTAPVTGQGPLLISMGLEVTKYTNSRSNRLPAGQRS